MTLVPAAPCSGVKPPTPATAVFSRSLTGPPSPDARAVFVGGRFATTAAGERSASVATVGPDTGNDAAPTILRGRTVHGAGRSPGDTEEQVTMPGVATPAKGVEPLFVVMFWCRQEVADILQNRHNSTFCERLPGAIKSPLLYRLSYALRACFGGVSCNSRWPKRNLTPAIDTRRTTRCHADRGIAHHETCESSKAEKTLPRVSAPSQCDQATRQEETRNDAGLRPVGQPRRGGGEVSCRAGQIASWYAPPLSSSATRNAPLPNEMPA